MLETLTCPHCQAKLQSSKTSSLPDTTVATCKTCSNKFSLKDARRATQIAIVDSFDLAPLPQEPIAIPQPPSFRQQVVIAKPEPRKPNVGLWIAIGAGAGLLGLALVAVAVTMLITANKPTKDIATSVPTSTPISSASSLPVQEEVATETEQPSPERATETAPQQPAAPEAKPVQFDFQGVKLGQQMNIDLAREFNMDVNNPNAVGSKYIQLGSAKVFVMLECYDWRLEHVGMSFDSDDFMTVVDAYSDKLGCPPHSLTTEDVQNRMGASFQNIKVAWHTTANTDLTIEKMGSKVTEGYGWVSTEGYNRRLDAKIQKEKQDNKNKL